MISGKTRKGSGILRILPPLKPRSSFSPSRWMYWNVHIDGLEYTHDLIVEREGVFKACVEAIRWHKILGYQVATNTTVLQRKRRSKSWKKCFEFFSSMEVDGHHHFSRLHTMREKDMVSRWGKARGFFLTRKMTRQKFAKIQEWENASLFRHAGYQEFLAGKGATCPHGQFRLVIFAGGKRPVI